LISEERVQSLVGDVATPERSYNGQKCAAQKKAGSETSRCETSTSCDREEEVGRKSSDDETIRMLQQEFMQTKARGPERRRIGKNAVQSNGS
jgi:hypothetical protein